jgi:DNA polymerase-3 subunit delta
VAIRGADGFVSKHRDILEKYFEKPAATGILVLTVSSWDARTRLAKMLPKIGKLIPLETPPRWKLPEHLVQHVAGKHKIRLNKDAAEMLVELIGEELPQLYNEVEKLVLFTRGEAAIRIDHVEALTGHHRIYDAFEVIDAMIGGHVGQAVSRLRNMFEEDKAPSIAGAFAFHLRRMFQAKVLLEKRTGTDAIAKQLRIWGNKDRFFAQLQRISLVQIAAFLEEQPPSTTPPNRQGQAPVLIEQLVPKLPAPGATANR